VCHSIEAAIEEVEHFYSNYYAFAVDEGWGVLTVRHGPNAEQLRHLNEEFAVFSTRAPFEFDGDQTLRFGFDGRNYVNLRLLIDVVNGWTSKVGSAA